MRREGEKEFEWARACRVEKDEQKFVPRGELSVRCDGKMV